MREAERQQSSYEGARRGVEAVTFEEWCERIQGKNRSAVNKFLAAEGNRERIFSAPGSRQAHHAWRGGYVEHLRQTMMIAAHNYELIQGSGFLESLPEDERFTLSDALTVLFLHDIEKPFIYDLVENDEIVTLAQITKHDRKLFRQKIIERYDFALTPTMENALQFVEGVRDEDYIPGERADQPLAALCHGADNLSARGLYNFGKSS